MRRYCVVTALVLTLVGCASRPVIVTPATSSNVAAECLKRDSSEIKINADATERIIERKSMTFTGNVVLCGAKSVQYADRLEIFLDDSEKTIVKIIATGNVMVLTSECPVVAARRAVYDGTKQRLMFSGDVRTVDGERRLRYERFVIDLSLPPGTPMRCDGPRKVPRLRLLTRVAGEGGGDAEADVHPAGDPALAGEHARAGAQPRGGGARAQRVQAVGHQP